jgi:hypothetical protein
MISTKNASSFDADPYRSRVLQVQARSHFDVGGWHSIVAVTFTLKQAIQQHGYVFYGREENYTKAFKRFMRRLNRAVYECGTPLRQAITSDTDNRKRRRWPVAYSRRDRGPCPHDSLAIPKRDNALLAYEESLGV